MTTPYQIQSPMRAQTMINGRLCDYFAGCGYLALQNDPDILQAAAATLIRYGLANAGGYSHDHPLYAELDQAAQQFFNTPHIRYFASGYLGNAMLAQGLSHQFDHIFIDESAHYSVGDGARTTGKPLTTFRHCDPDDLRTKLHHHLRPGERPLLMTDGVFPVSGEIAPIPAYQQTLAPYNGLLLLDDAHATGVLGSHGRGTLEYFHLTDPNSYTAHTLSKALGSFGGIIAGDDTFMAQLDSHDRVRKGASLPPLPLAAAACRALEIATRPTRRQQLWQNVAHARAGLRALGWDLPNTPVPILCLPWQPGLDFPAIVDTLFMQNILIAHSQDYTSTPAGGALRIAIFATHTSEQIDHLLAALSRLL